MTDKEIIKALEWHLNDETHCTPCPYEEHSVTHSCVEMLIADTLDLINRQQAELDDLKRDTIPKLQEGLKRANKYGLETDNENEQLKAEIERLSNSAKQWEDTAKDLFISKEKQQAEIERLNEEKAKFDNTILYDLEQVNKIVETARAEAIKEFEYKLLDVSHLRIPQKIYPGDIRKIKKEMVGEDK